MDKEAGILMPIDFAKLLQRCDTHEEMNCAICNGDEQRQKLVEMDAETARRARAASLPTGMIAARFPGHCAGCGESFDAGDVIRHSKTADGWVAMACCG